MARCSQNPLRSGLRKHPNHLIATGHHRSEVSRRKANQWPEKAPPPDIGDLSTRSGRSQPKLSPREAAGFAAAHSAPSRQQDHTKRPGLKVICTRRQLTIAQLLLGHSTHMPSQTLLRTTSRSRTDRLGTSCHSTSVHKHTIVLRIHWRIVQCHSLHQVTP